jgi:NTP pyrophosphatase (non-canonical NTP hydrolase)
MDNEGDETTPVSELKQLVRRFVEERDWDQFHTPKDLAIGLSVEAAELLEHFRFRSDEEMERLLQDEDQRTQISHELADVLYFVLLMSANLGFDVSTILRDKVQLSGQNYPVAQARGVNEKYTELPADQDSH